MKRSRFLLAVCSLSLVLSACNLFGGGDGGEASSSRSSAQSVSSVRETPNVSYRGTVQPSGISIYMEGTHRLVLDDGRFILLGSDAVNLNDYIGKEVEVKGAIRPTVEGEGTFMRVESVVDMSGDSSSATSSSDSSVSSDSSASSVSSTSSSATSVSSSTTSSSRSSSSSSVSSVSSDSSVSSSSGVSADLQAQIDIMAKENLDPARWTQKYCSSHIEFCVDVHKNWWFKSFGTTTTALWHVEISTHEIDAPGQGPITIRVLSGDSASAGGVDGQVKTDGGTATGFKNWTEGRHFEIRGPAVLQAAIAYLTAHITASAAQ